MNFVFMKILNINSQHAGNPHCRILDGHAYLSECYVSLLECAPMFSLREKIHEEGGNVDHLLRLQQLLAPESMAQVPYS
jgi:hypothetical protein